MDWPQFGALQLLARIRLNGWLVTAAPFFTSEKPPLRGLTAQHGRLREHAQLRAYDLNVFAICQHILAYHVVHTKSALQCLERVGSSGVQTLCPLWRSFASLLLYLYHPRLAELEDLAVVFLVATFAGFVEMRNRLNRIINPSCPFVLQRAAYDLAFTCLYLSLPGVNSIVLLSPSRF